MARFFAVSPYPHTLERALRAGTLVDALYAALSDFDALAICPKGAETPKMPSQRRSRPRFPYHPLTIPTSSLP